VTKPQSTKLLTVVVQSGWHAIIVLTVHASTKNKIEDIADNFYEKLEHAFIGLP
jgi:hypothetical protein